MTVANTVAGSSSAQSQKSGLREFRIIPRIETYPSVVRFAQSAAGKLVLLAGFGIVLSFLMSPLGAAILTVPLLLTTFAPAYRMSIAAGFSVAFLFFTFLNQQMVLGMALAVIATGMLLYWSVYRWPKAHLSRRPVAFLLWGFTALIVAANFAASGSTLRAVLWAAVNAAAIYVWFIAYALIERDRNPARDWVLQLASFRPFWGSTTTPFPKGAAYLRRIEARTPEQLAVAQLKGLKLLAWALLLSLLQSLWNRFFHGYLRIPTSAEALGMSAHGMPVAWHIRWESVILSFFENVMAMSIMGHRFIAVCRFAGYNALRNTYRPLSSRTVAEFFNRYYYYFKELLVDFFFYPAFMRYWKKNKKLRMVFATFAAAFFGNAFFHFTRDWEIIRDRGMWKAFTNYEAELIYCFVLATALSISELRKRKPRPASFLRGQLLPTLWVIFFYCILNVLVTDERHYELVDYLRYFASLFFVRF